MILSLLSKRILTSVACIGLCLFFIGAGCQTDNKSSDLNEPTNNSESSEEDVILESGMGGGGYDTPETTDATEDPSVDNDKSKTTPVTLEPVPTSDDSTTTDSSDPQIASFRGIVTLCFPEKSVTDKEIIEMMAGIEEAENTSDITKADIPFEKYLGTEASLFLQLANFLPRDATPEDCSKILKK
ncbi:MAG: hypothetical protein HOC34_03850 [Candidatus Magasanikbacteria bacterium]|jgi:hypothetical protein|nr:hypothetical protein [Candidatus Magasanikbacteria bacterium]MBT4221246.1 hypothetical protein [Candidatus Magasanikbacteria bacterium]MBT4350392.1 hypothetical protein [Candidatus Magasanikbacteria bacterium]MBT4542061.1 hypothetical protein [Candidatus Magasanikbacteria bacterium]MBT6253579.1 hypothetical protein [Candidatus Magasanikbacteria bacterium]